MNNIKIFKILCILTLGLLLFAGCTGKPGEELARSELQKKLDKYFRQRFSVEDLKKTNGISSEKNGIKMYSLEFEAVIKALRVPPRNIAIWNVSGIKQRFGNRFIQDIYFLKKDEVAVLQGTMKFIKTEKGWRKKL